MTKIITFLTMFLFLWTGNIYSQDNQLTAKEKKEGWVLLFNGKNLDGWTSVGKDTPPAFGWVVEDGILNVRKQGDKRGGDIITRDQYSDFDLKVDFRITKGANSGIKYFFTKYEKGGWLGLEYQILDDENHPDAKLGRDGNRLEGGLYDMLPTSPKQVNPIGEWNQARIVAKGTKVTHYLNGKKILSFDRSSEQYKKAWQLSKYKNSKPMFGDVKEGHILLQDHGDEVSFRNVKIKVLK
ncbi:DUF1080 domain-containing protein [Parabacteroides sp. AF17-28]|uniref:3-keto-disaccharide hydrolase n=1 Tax=Parabacteroides sp. AF17-28 TaxID=2292241 RepID=UPI001F1F4537|nr:DUF1080 domain-containing protein [Parabacteroides sp. AF17-28]